MIVYFLSLFIYLGVEGQRERERERENPKKAPSYQHGAPWQRGVAGLLGIVRSWPELKSRAGRLID